MPVKKKCVSYSGGLAIDHCKQKAVMPDGSSRPLKAKERMEMHRREKLRQSGKKDLKNTLKDVCPYA